MELKEAYRNATNKDKLKLYDKLLFMKSEISSQKMTGPQALSIAWEVVRKKKKPINYEEWHFSLTAEQETGMGIGWINVWKASEENTHLLYADLIEIAEKIRDRNKNASAPHGTISYYEWTSLDDAHTALTEAQS